MELVWLPFYPSCLQPFDSSTKTKCCLHVHNRLHNIEMIAGLDLGEPAAPAPAPAATAKKNKKKKNRKKK